MNTSSINAPPVVVETPAMLHIMIDHLSAFRVIALDTESNSLFAYQEKVCLLQFSTPGKDFVVDALALKDLSPLRPILEDSRHEKVIHGADYDVGVLRRDYDFDLGNLFDTMVASRILGIRQYGLGSLLEARFGFKLDKRMQRHDWSRRPLGTAELQYARLDTHYLLPLRDQLLDELRAMGREIEAREAFARVAQVEWNRKPFDPEDFWRVKDACSLDPRERGILKHLFILREERARHLDRPPFKVLSDKVLIEISRAGPSSMPALRRVGGIPERQLRQIGEDLLLAVRRGRAEPQELSSRPVRSSRPDERVLELYEELRCWRKEEGLRRNVEPDVLISNNQLMEIARVYPKTIDQLRGVEGLGDYQISTYGDSILAMINRRGD